MSTSWGLVRWRIWLGSFLAIALATQTAIAQLSGFFQSAPGSTANYEYLANGWQAEILPLNVSILFSDNNPTSMLTATILTPMIGAASDGTQIYPIASEFPLRVTATSQDGHNFHGTLHSQYLFDWKIEPVDGGVNLSGNVYWAGGRFEATTITHALLPPALVGDYNQDGVVDAADYATWRNEVGTANSLANDPIGGDIRTAQYDQWRAHFGQTVGNNGTISTSGSSIPEPSSIVLLVAAFMAAILTASHRQMPQPD
jgi:hypothetical protein